MFDINIENKEDMREESITKMKKDEKEYYDNVAKAKAVFEKLKGPFVYAIRHKVHLSHLGQVESEFLDSHNIDLPVVDNNNHILEKTGRTITVSDLTNALGKSLLMDAVHAKLFIIVTGQVNLFC